MGDPTALGTPHSAPALAPARGKRPWHPAPHSAPGTRHPARPAPSSAPAPQMGRRQAPALAGAAHLLSGIFGRSFEPFVGSGAVFFDLYASGRLAGARATLTDCNADLIGCYRVVRDRTVDVHRALARLARGHETGAADHFYAVRERFNRVRARLARRRRRRQLHAGAGRDADLPEPHRVQRAVPSECRRALQRAGGSLRAAPDLRPCAPGGRRRGAGYPPASASTWPRSSPRSDAARAGDLVYFDPPYAPVSGTARFTSYTARPFTLDDHIRLRDCAIALARRGCAVMVSNSSAPAMSALYEEDRRAARRRPPRVPHPRHAAPSTPADHRAARSPSSCSRISIRVIRNRQSSQSSANSTAFPTTRLSKLRHFISGCTLIFDATRRLRHPKLHGGAHCRRRRPARTGLATDTWHDSPVAVVSVAFDRRRLRPHRRRTARRAIGSADLHRRASRADAGRRGRRPGRDAGGCRAGRSGADRRRRDPRSLPASKRRSPRSGRGLVAPGLPLAHHRGPQRRRAGVPGHRRPRHQRGLNGRCARRSGGSAFSSGWPISPFATT